MEVMNVMKLWLYVQNYEDPFVESADDFTDQWKILIYDQDCRDIISPLMNVGSLRQKGVTLHMLVMICNRYRVVLNYEHF